MYNILVTGADGQLGSELKDLAPNYGKCNFLFTDYKTLDITKYKDVKHFVDGNEINVIINCAAYTQVDKAEEEIELADSINHLAVANLAKIAKTAQLKLIHISTDYVFDGTSDKPYTEEDVPNPQSVYGKTKLEGEKALQKINPANSIIIRTSWLYSSYGNNFVKTMLRLAREKKVLSVISDQIGTPTYAGDLAKTILEMLPKINNADVEIYNYSNEGVSSWYDFAKAIFEMTKLDIKVNPIPTSAYPTPAKRPTYSILDKEKIKKDYKVAILHWKEALEVCLEKISS